MEKQFFFEEQYNASLEGMGQILGKAEQVFRIFTQYPGLPVFSEIHFKGITDNDAVYLHSLIREAANKDLIDLQANRPYTAPATILIPALWEISGQFGSFSAGYKNMYHSLINHFLKPVVSTSFLDFDPETGLPSFGERGKAEIRAKCTITLTGKNLEVFEIMNSLQDAWLRAKKFQVKQGLDPNPIRFAIDSKSEHALLQIDRQGNLNFNRKLFV